MRRWTTPQDRRDLSDLGSAEATDESVCDSLEESDRLDTERGESTPCPIDEDDLDDMAEARHTIESSNAGRQEHRHLAKAERELRTFRLAGRSTEQPGESTVME